MSQHRKKRSRPVGNRTPKDSQAAHGPIGAPPPLVVFVAAATLFGVYWTSGATGKFQGVNVLNAVLSAALLRVFGVDTDRFASVLQFKHSGMEIISECSGTYVIILFATGVLPFPSTWRACLAVLAVPHVPLTNLVRAGRRTAPGGGRA